MGPLQSHKCQCEKRKTSDFVDGKAHVGRWRLTGAQCPHLKGMATTQRGQLLSCKNAGLVLANPPVFPEKVERLKSDFQHPTGAKQTPSVATSGLRVPFQAFLKQEGLSFPHTHAGLACRDWGTRERREIPFPSLTPAASLSSQKLPKEPV